ncbi:MAG: hypothetical protein K1X28_09035 [Parachlamydiales bacterium]|nr:hypothetical protein [Parachlamydiales bacterium]
MLKTIWICAACLWGAHLSAESIGNVEFQFPASNYDWKVLMEKGSAKAFFAPEEDEEECCDCQFKLLTHREGDALEVVIAMQHPLDDDEKDDEPDTLATFQEHLDENLNQYLPNHRLTLLQFEDFGDEAFLEYELNDGSVDVMHGYARYFRKGDSSTFILYLTTAVQTEYNRAVWTQVLNDAR